MKKFLSFFNTEKSKALEVRADFRLGSDLHTFDEKSDIYVRAEFLNLAGSEEPDNDYFIYLIDFCRHFRAKGVHATFASFEHKGLYFFDPVPPILSPSLLPKAVERIQRFSNRLELPISVRNFFDPQLNLPTFTTEANFFRELVGQSECNFICDVASSVSFARTFGHDSHSQVKELLNIERTSAFVRTNDEIKLVSEVGFSGPLMSFEELEGVSIFSEGEFHDPQ